jgi:hypothetical protein
VFFVDGYTLSSSFLLQPKLVKSSVGMENFGTYMGYNTNTTQPTLPFRVGGDINHLHPVTNNLTFFFNTKPLVDNPPLAFQKLHD